MFFGSSNFPDFLFQAASFSKLLVQAASFSSLLVQPFRCPLSAMGEMDRIYRKVILRLNAEDAGWVSKVERAQDLGTNITTNNRQAAAKRKKYEGQAKEGGVVAIPNTTSNSIVHNRMRSLVGNSSSLRGKMRRPRTPWRISPSHLTMVIVLQRIVPWL
jgi:hypothetical protein